VNETYVDAFERFAGNGGGRGPAGLVARRREAFERFAKTGTGPRAQRAKARLAELVDEIKELGQP